MDDIRLGSRVEWLINNKGVGIPQIGRVVKVLHHDDISGPRRIAAKRFPEHKIMFKGYGIPGGVDKGYLVESFVGDMKLLFMPTPASLRLAEGEAVSNTELDRLEYKAKYKERQHLLQKTPVNIHRFSTRGAGKTFPIGEGKHKKLYAFDRNGCIRRTDKLN